MHSYFKNHTLAAGALLLTLTGIASRILGFFYRIFLSRTIGAEGLGVYPIDVYKRQAEGHGRGRGCTPDPGAL